jgi:Zn-dependent M28 family amino/carboxypeptidase
VFFAVFLVLAALTVSGCGSDDSTEPTQNRFSADRAFADLEAQVEIGERPSGTEANAETANFIASSLRKAGTENVQVQSPWRNVVATIPGTGEGTLVVGAHHDTKNIPGFLGANDGASGVAVVLELARVLAADAPLEGPSVSIVLFDAEEARGTRPFEEDGTRGSQQYVAYAKAEKQGSPPLETINSMVLFDMVGDCGLAIPREALSDESLYDHFAEAAREVNGSDSAAPFEGVTDGVSDDHVPFVKAGIPALDIIDFTFGGDTTPGQFWHTNQDTLDKVCPDSLDAVGEPAVRVLSDR